ncbi:MAG: FHA domain-containing protein [Holophaga sp.]|nr:FHA domain-containing protein [Holophaga sp.]
MIVACPTCSARFQYDDARFQGVPRKRFRCPKCVSVFEVDNPALVPDPPTAPLKQEEPEEVRRIFAPTAAPEPSFGDADIAPRETTAHRDRDSMLAGAGIAAPLPQGMRFSLAFLSGPQASTVRALSTAQTVIGREEGDIITNDPECSRRHCRIDIHADGSVWLVDLGSTNGTFVDGIQIYGTVQLADRQEFVCGRSTFMLLARAIDPHGMI